MPAFYQVFAGSGLPPQEKISLTIFFKGKEILELGMVIKVITHGPRVNRAPE